MNGAKPNPLNVELAIELALTIVNAAIDPQATKTRLDDLIAKIKESDIKLAELEKRGPELTAREVRLADGEAKLKSREASHIATVDGVNKDQTVRAQGLAARETVIANREIGLEHRVKELEAREVTLVERETRLVAIEADFTAQRQKLETDRRDLAAKVAGVQKAMSA